MTTLVKNTMKKLSASLSSALLLALLGVSTQAEEVRIYNWVDYIGKDTVANFEKETGIKVVYDLTTSWETSEAKILSGDSGYDVVFMGSTYLARQVGAGVWAKLDKSKLPNWASIDPEILKSVQKFDPGNEHMQPYTWYGLGEAYNKAEYEKRFPGAAKPDSWSFLLEPSSLSKMESCGVVWTDGYGDMFVPALLYAGKDPFSENRKDYEEVFEKILPLRPFIRTFSWTYYDGMADGEFCASPTWTGDMAYNKAVGKIKPGIELVQVIPKEGTYMDYEGLGILESAKNKDGAYKFLNFLLRPKEAAQFTEDIRYPNVVPDSQKLIPKDVLSSVWYPKGEELKNAHVWPATYNPTITRLQTRLWTKFKTNM